MKAVTRDYRSTVLLDSIRRLHRRGATGNLLNLLQRVHPADLHPQFKFFTDVETHDILKLLMDKDLSRAAEVSLLHDTLCFVLLRRQTQLVRGQAHAVTLHHHSPMLLL